MVIQAIPYAEESPRPTHRVGTVYACNPATFTVDVQLGPSETQIGVPILNTYGGPFARDMSWLQHLLGARVVLMLVASQYYVLGTLASQVFDTDASEAAEILLPGYGGTEESTYGAHENRNFHAQRPQDFFPGDKILRSTSGALLGLLSEGSVVLKASALSQIIMGRFKDFCRIIARKFELFTDFGEVTSAQTEEGRVGIQVKGGADFLTETHPTQGKWTVQVWLGDDPENPENRLKVKVNNPDDSEHVTMEMDTEGNMTVDTTNDYTATHGGDRTTTIKGDDTTTTNGNMKETVKGKGTLSVSKVLTIKSSTKVVVKAPQILLN